MDIKILVLEDEMPIRSFIRIKLKALGYEVIEAENGREALEKANEKINIALLDVMLPDIDGIEVCRKLRIKYPYLGIIMLTAKGQEEDKILGLTSGADDYIVKPFSPKELAARIDSLLRRLNINTLKEQEKAEIFNIGPYSLNVKGKTFSKNDKLIQLTPTEYAITELLISNPHKAFSRNEILDKVWGKNYMGDLKIVDVNMSRIRQKIEDDPAKPEYLKTVWGYGYIWSVEK